MKKKKIRLRYKKERALFSDVLPYELPLIFSNRYFYKFLVRNGIWIEISAENKSILHWNETKNKGILALLSIMFCCNKDEKSSSKSHDKQSINCINSESSTYTINSLKRIPFVYSIQHKPFKHRYLSLIHPINQIKVVEFYNKYKDTIIYLCSKSNFSIRYPYKVACYFYYKDRLHHELLGKKMDKMEMYFSEYENLRTYFSYKQYNNIYKFYEDYRYQRAEKKFTHLLKMDVQSFFDSIYTHSIAWAISGGLDIYKDTFYGGCDGSIGACWDKMMQEMNYNETNGIVIGPECSRIFAEVIMQHIDQMVEQQLLAKGYRHKVDYECYRYVDDYFFFYNNEIVKAEAEQLLQSFLKEFKLSLSQEKSKVLDRPFVTAITKAKIVLDELLNDSIKLYFDNSNLELFTEEETEDVEQDLSEEKEEFFVSVDRQKAIECIECGMYFRLKATDFNKKFKAIISANEVDYKDILNYTLSRLSIRVERTLRKFDKYYKLLCLTISNPNLTDLQGKAEKKKQQLEKDLTKFIVNVLDIVFFLYANSKRINTTLKVIQIINVIRIYLDNDYCSESYKKKEIVKRFAEYAREITFKKIREEISLVLHTTPIDETMQMETLYFLIVLRSMNSKYYLTRNEIERYLRIKYNDEGAIISFPTLNMLAVTILIYYFGNLKQYEELKNILVDRTLQYIDKVPKERRKISAEYVIFALDIAACPYVSPDDKINFLEKVGASKQEGKAIVEYMKHQKYIFTKWTGIDITKELNAKISQEVYS